VCDDILIAAMADDPASLLSLLNNSLNKIVKAAGSSKKFKTLRDAAQQIMDELRAKPPTAESVAVTTSASGPSPARTQDADRHFLPFKLACETRKAELMEIALDCIQKLIAFGYLRGTAAVDRTLYPTDGGAPKGNDAFDAPSSSGSGSAEAAAVASAKQQNSRRLIDLIIETICECSTFQDDGVQLQARFNADG
jgi:hypothetical protein